MERVALVTGSRKGIGRYLAERLIEDGFAVVGCSRDESDLRHERYLHVQADVSDPVAVRALFKQIHAAHGRLDVTINNAGVASLNHSLLVPPETIARIMGINVQGAFQVSQESVKLMRRGGAGRIVNLTTVAVALDLEGESVYAASKAALETLTRILSREFAGFGVTVNAVGPTPIDTDLIRNVPADKIKKIVDRLAIPRLGKLADVYNVVDFFIRPQSDYITGQVLYLGGA